MYLFCSAGMSTSLLAGNMQKAANDREIPMMVKAFPYEQMEEICSRDSPDCVLLGPQVKFIVEEAKKKFSAMSIPAAMIDPADYGTMNGERVLANAILMIKQNKSKEEVFYEVSG